MTPRAPASSTRCRACRLLPELCLCAAIRPERCATRLILCRHEKETRRVSATTPLLCLALPQTEVRTVGADGGPPADFSDVAEAGGVLLYPGPAAQTLTAPVAAALPRPLTLVVPDGNWNQTKRMVKRVPGLARLPAVSLPAPSQPSVRARHGAAPQQMATLEAVARALAVLEDPALGERLLRLQERAATAHLVMRGRLPARALRDL